RRHDAAGAVLVGDRAGDGLRDAPHELRDGEGEADRGDAEPGGGVERADEERHRLPHAEDKREHESGRGDDPELTAGHCGTRMPSTVSAAAARTTSQPPVFMAGSLI